jgi:hypothetical protein
MAWTNSKIFQATIIDACGNTTAFDFDADIPKVALFDNSITPSQTVASASTAYAAGVWAAGGVSDASGWPAAGRVLVTPTWSAAAGVCTYDAADTVSANSTTTLAGTFGCLVYDDTLAAVVIDQGMSYHYFGGTQSVTAGTFTIVWNASGILALTL